MILIIIGKYIQNNVSIKMIEYDRIDLDEGIDVNKIGYAIIGIC